MSKAVPLYVDICRRAMQLDLQDPASWEEIARSLPVARQPLMCCVCGRLLEHPTGPAQSICHHFVCQACVGGKMRFIKNGCGWCKDVSEYVPNEQLAGVVKCFRQLCVYLRGYLSYAAHCGTDMDVAVAIIREVVPTVSLETPPEIPTVNVDAVKKEKSLPPSSPTKAAMVSAPELDEPCIAAPSNAKTMKRSTGQQGRRSRPARTSEPHRKRTKTNGSRSRNRGSRNSSEALSNSDVDVIGRNSECDATSSWTVDERHNVSSHHSVVTEETILENVYDPHWPLMENSVLAEHDYNKYVTSTSAAHDGIETSLNAVGAAPASSQPPKLVRLVQTTTKRLPTRKPSSSSCRGTPIRKQSLTIRQLSEGGGSGLVSQSHSIGSKRSTDYGDVSSSEVAAAGAPMASRRQKSSAPKVKVGCRCAMATPAPGKLTCCGQRCPCYAAFHGCTSNCKCRGCRNPRGDPVDRHPTLTIVPVSTATLKPSASAGDVRHSLSPTLNFDSSTSIFNVRDSYMLHSSSRFSSEPVSCFGSG